MVFESRLCSKSDNFHVLPPLRFDRKKLRFGRFRLTSQWICYGLGCLLASGNDSLKFDQIQTFVSSDKTWFPFHGQAVTISARCLGSHEFEFICGMLNDRKHTPWGVSAQKAIRKNDDFFSVLRSGSWVYKMLHFLKKNICRK